jgi:hypothetical protein
LDGLLLGRGEEKYHIASPTSMNSLTVPGVMEDFKKAIKEDTQRGHQSVRLVESGQLYGLDI